MKRIFDGNKVKLQNVPYRPQQATLQNYAAITRNKKAPKSQTITVMQEPKYYAATTTNEAYI